MVRRHACKGGVVLALLLCVTAVSSHQQRLETASQPAQFARTLWEAAGIYRSGDIARALAMIAPLALADQTKGIGEIHSQQSRILAGWPPKKDDLQLTPPLLRALGALQMEMARRAFWSEDPAGQRTGLDYIVNAKQIFALAFEATKEPNDSAARWILAMGQEQYSEGRFSLAQTILMPGCDELPPYAPLLIACGSLHETFGSFPYDAGASNRPGEHVFRPLGSMGGADLLAPSARTMILARSVRKAQLAAARKYLERALAVDKTDPELALRLANVRYQQGDHAESALLLEPIVAPGGRVLTVRERYLARLFLGRALERQKRAEDAASLYDEAIALLPAQSALLARASYAQQRGNAAEAATLAERAATSSETEDPWWSYRFGQFWLTRNLYAALRSEARQ